MLDLQGKHKALADKAIDYLEEKVAGEGLSAVNARDIASHVGVSVGTIYNIFGSLDDVIMHLNSRTLRRLDVVLSGIAEEYSDDQPLKRLLALAYGYLYFVLQNRNLWGAIFEHVLPAGAHMPEWHRDEHYVLFKHISEPLSQVVTGKSEEDLVRLSRTIYSAVHGIVSLSIHTRLEAVPLDVLKDQIALVVTAFVEGYRSLNEAAPEGRAA